MIVADTSPLNYLVLINEIDLLPRLYDRFLIPESVRTELSAAETPQLVRAWAANLPEWIEVSTAVRHDDKSLSRLHPGERDAISLALEVHAKAVLMDERHGRQEAKKRGLRVIGTLGVLTAAHELGLIDLIAAIDSLRQTSFHIFPSCLPQLLGNMDINSKRMFVAA